MYDLTWAARPRDVDGGRVALLLDRTNGYGRARGSAARPTTLHFYQYTVHACVHTRVRMQVILHVPTMYLYMWQIACIRLEGGRIMTLRHS